MVSDNFRMPILEVHLNKCSVQIRNFKLHLANLLVAGNLWPSNDNLMAREK